MACGLITLVLARQACSCANCSGRDFGTEAGLRTRLKHTALGGAVADAKFAPHPSYAQP